MNGGADYGAVSSVAVRVRGLAGRTVTAGRSLLRGVDWPPVASAVLGLVSLVEITLRKYPKDFSPVIALLLALLVTAPLALARTRPIAATVAATAGILLTHFLHLRPTVAGTGALLLLFGMVGRYRSRRAGLAVIAPLIGYAVSPWPEGRPGGRLVALLLLALAAGALVAGLAARRWAEAADRDASRRAIADSLLEHAARGERARIARELHDVVAHHISMISVQAEAARLTTPDMPDEGARRLVAIAETARTALTEMRRLLGVLRDDAGTPRTTRAPQPGLQQLADLIDEARASTGASTRLIVHGRLAPLDPGIELTAYRVIQEALTNARRHAPGAAVDVEIEYAEETVRIRIRDNGPGPDPYSSDTGHGLVGMRERVGMAGGTLTIGPAPIGGFLVEASLPVSAANRAGAPA